MRRLLWGVLLTQLPCLLAVPLPLECQFQLFSGYEATTFGDAFINWTNVDSDSPRIADMRQMIIDSTVIGDIDNPVPTNWLPYTSVQMWANNTGTPVRNGTLCGFKREFSFWPKTSGQATLNGANYNGDWARSHLLRQTTQQSCGVDIVTDGGYLYRLNIANALSTAGTMSTLRAREVFSSNITTIASGWSWNGRYLAQVGSRACNIGECDSQSSALTVRIHDFTDHIDQDYDSFNLFNLSFYDFTGASYNNLDGSALFPTAANYNGLVWLYDESHIVLRLHDTLLQFVQIDWTTRTLTRGAQFNSSFAPGCKFGNMAPYMDNGYPRLIAVAVYGCTSRDDRGIRFYTPTTNQEPLLQKMIYLSDPGVFKWIERYFVSPGFPSGLDVSALDWGFNSTFGVRFLPDPVTNRSQCWSALTIGITNGGTCGTCRPSQVWVLLMRNVRYAADASGAVDFETLFFGDIIGHHFRPLPDPDTYVRSIKWRENGLSLALGLANTLTILQPQFVRWGAQVNNINSYQMGLYPILNDADAAAYSWTSLRTVLNVAGPGYYLVDSVFARPSLYPQAIGGYPTSLQWNNFDDTDYRVYVQVIETGGTETRVTISYFTGGFPYDFPYTSITPILAVPSYPFLQTFPVNNTPATMTAATFTFATLGTSHKHSSVRRISSMCTIPYPNIVFLGWTYVDASFTQYLLRTKFGPSDFYVGTPDGTQLYVNVQPVALCTADWTGRWCNISVQSQVCNNQLDRSIAANDPLRSKIRGYVRTSRQLWTADDQRRLKTFNISGTGYAGPTHWCVYNEPDPPAMDRTLTSSEFDTVYYYANGTKYLVVTEREGFPCRLNTTCNCLQRYAGSKCQHDLDGACGYVVPNPANTSVWVQATDSMLQCNATGNQACGADEALIGSATGALPGFFDPIASTLHVESQRCRAPGLSSSAGKCLQPVYGALSTLTKAGCFECPSPWHGRFCNETCVSTTCGQYGTACVNRAWRPTNLASFSSVSGRYTNVTSLFLALNTANASWVQESLWATDLHCSCQRVTVGSTTYEWFEQARDVNTNEILACQTCMRVNVRSSTGASVADPSCTSGRGTCVPSTVRCACSQGYVGSACQIPQQVSFQCGSSRSVNVTCILANTVDYTYTCNTNSILDTGTTSAPPHQTIPYQVECASVNLFESLTDLSSDDVLDPNADELSRQIACQRVRSKCPRTRQVWNSATVSYQVCPLPFWDTSSSTDVRCNEFLTGLSGTPDCPFCDVTPGSMLTGNWGDVSFTCYKLQDTTYRCLNDQGTSTQWRLACDIEYTTVLTSLQLARFVWSTCAQ